MEIFNGLLAVGGRVEGALLWPFLVNVVNSERFYVILRRRFVQLSLIYSCSKLILLMLKLVKLFNFSPL